MKDEPLTVDLVVHELKQRQHHSAVLVKAGIGGPQRDDMLSIIVSRQKAKGLSIGDVLKVTLEAKHHD